MRGGISCECEYLRSVGAIWYHLQLLGRVRLDSNNDGLVLWNDRNLFHDWMWSRIRVYWWRCATSWLQLLDWVRVDVQHDGRMRRDDRELLYDWMRCWICVHWWYCTTSGVHVCGRLFFFNGIRRLHEY